MPSRIVVQDLTEQIDELGLVPAHERVLTPHAVQSFDPPGQADHREAAGHGVQHLDPGAASPQPHFHERPGSPIQGLRVGNRSGVLNPWGG
jgi:hypothetical protein